MTTKKPCATAGAIKPKPTDESAAAVNSAKTAEKPPTDSVAGYVASSSSKATKRAYASDVRHFIR